MKELDPRSGKGKEIADSLDQVYQKAFADFAGPQKFRHSCNYDTYRRAALIAVHQHLKSEFADTIEQLQKENKAWCDVFAKFDSMAAGSSKPGVAELAEQAKGAIDFYDRTCNGSEADKIAVGTDHYNLVISTLRDIAEHSSSKESGK